MQFQGRELHVGDKLVSKRHGEIKVSVLYGTWFSADCKDGSRRDWEYSGQYADVTDTAIDATWPDAAPDANPAPDREAEYRRFWIECAMRAWISSHIKDPFTEADAFVAELRKRDGEGK